MSLAVGAHKGKTTHIYAGVNSSPASILKGNNEHLRSIVMEQSKSRASVGLKTPTVKLAEMSRTSIFSKGDPEEYQRLLRVAGKMGVAASALGKEPGLAVFEVNGTSLKPKGVLELPREAEDLDIIQTGDDEWQVAYCYKFQVFTINIGKEVSDPEEIWVTPEESPRPAFRSIRYLSKDFLLAAVNLPSRSGVLLHGYRLPSKGKPARLAVSARISRNISATALSVTNLNLPSEPGLPLGDTQFLVAVASNDSSVSLFGLEHYSSASIDLIRKLYPLCTLKDVHSGSSITGLAFSTFVPPKTHSIRPQFVKLASISLQKTVAVHTIPLEKHVDKTQRDRRGPPRLARYVTRMKAKGDSPRPLIITLTVFVLIMAIVGQTMMEVYGKGRPVLGVSRFLPSWHGTLRDPNHQPAAFLEDDFLSKLSGGRRYGPGETLVLWQETATSAATTTTAADAAEETTGWKGDEALKLDVHDAAVHGPGKTWDELAEEQKEAWKEKLKQAGAWTQGMGESVFRGILFGELKAVVAQAVGG